MAFAGGAVANIAAEKYEEYLVKNGKEVKEKQTPLLIAGLAAAVHYMGKGKMDALAMGMMGAAGADLGLQMYQEMGSSSGDGSSNGTPSQMSPQLNGWREKALAIARQNKHKAQQQQVVKTVQPSQPSRTGGFYTNPYSNARVA